MGFLNDKRKKLIYFIPVIVLLVVIGVALYLLFKNNVEIVETPVVKEPYVPDPIVTRTNDVSEGAWIVYWEPDSNETVENTEYIIGEQVYFAVLFDQRGNLYIPDSLKNVRNSIDWNTPSHQYLCITNDVIYDDGTAGAKTTDCLDQLLTTPEHMDEMAHAMFDAAASLRCDGVEMDIENLTSGKNYWPQYVKLLERCVYWAQQYNMDCRVALGAYAPMADYDFPEELEYTYMCYALHGKFNDPGPKVTQKFLYDTVKRFSNVKRKRFAISNECFDWWPAEKPGRYNCVTLTMDDIYDIFEEHKDVAINRDPDSYGLYFNYWDDNGKHTVWYQDEKTFEFWKEKLREYNGDNNTGVDLWRIE